MEYAAYIANGEIGEGFLGEGPVMSQMEEQNTPSQLPDSEDVPNTSKSQRAKNFSIEEDEKIVSSWLNVGVDPVVGSQQRAGTFWNRIHQLYLETSSSKQYRTAKSIESRWGHIQDHVNKFCGCVDQVQRYRASGTNDDDKLSQACKMFKTLHKKPFTLLHCWRLLRNHPKWNSLLSASKGKATMKGTPIASVPVTVVPNTDSSVHLDDSTPSTGNDSMQRPPGKKAAKKRSREGTEGSYNVLVEELRNDRRETSQMQQHALTIEMEMVAIKKDKVRVQENELQFQASSAISWSSNRS